MTSFKILADTQQGASLGKFKTIYFLNFRLGFNLASREDKIKTFDAGTSKPNAVCVWGFPCPTRRAETQPLALTASLLASCGFCTASKTWVSG